MRKHSKFITILLSALLAVCLVQTVFVQAFATENSATPDEPTGGLRPVSMEVVKAPKTVNFLEGEELDSNFWSNVVLHIVYSDGREFDVNCDGIDSERGILPPIAEIDSYTGDITVGYYREDGTANFTVEYCYNYEHYITATFSVDVMQPVSMEVVKAPESVTVLRDEISDSSFWSNVVLHIVYSNGEEYDVNCDGADSEGGIVPPVAEICGYAGNITVDYYCIGDTVDFTVDYCYASSEDDGWERNTISAEYSVKEVADPHSIARVEVTKLPDKVFTAPLWTGKPDDFSTTEGFLKWNESLDTNNAISHNCEGMEVTAYYANGEKCGTFAVDNFTKAPLYNYSVNYWLNDIDEYGNYLFFQVNDLGNYEFSVLLDGDQGEKIVYTAKSASNPNPSIKPVSTEDTPAKPEKPSGNISSATSDVATNDNAGNNNTTNGTANNGVVATGDFATPAIITVVMLSAVAVMFVFKRKRMF